MIDTGVVNCCNIGDCNIINNISSDSIVKIVTPELFESVRVGSTFIVFSLTDVKIRGKIVGITSLAFREREKSGRALAGVEKCLFDAFYSWSVKSCTGKVIVVILFWTVVVTGSALTRIVTAGTSTGRTRPNIRIITSTYKRSWSILTGSLKVKIKVTN